MKKLIASVAAAALIADAGARCPDREQHQDGDHQGPRRQGDDDRDDQGHPDLEPRHKIARRGQEGITRATHKMAAKKKTMTKKPAATTTDKTTG